jgi:hypothetical protein
LPEKIPSSPLDQLQTAGNFQIRRAPPDLKSNPQRVLDYTDPHKIPTEHLNRAKEPRLGAKLLTSNGSDSPDGQI